MATWKKLLVSGSDISQLNNDAGFLTSNTEKNGFATASFDGTNLTADSSVGQLNFTSGSGGETGLLITATAGSDTLDFSLGTAAVPNAALTNDSIQIGTTDIELGATGSTVVDLTLTGVQASGSFTGSFTGDGSGLVGTGGSIISGEGDDNQVAVFNSSNTIDGYANFTFNDVTNTLTVTGDQLITGDLTVQGTASFQNTENLLVSDRFVLFASGSTTTGDGGIVVQQATQDVGELFGYDSGTTRWALDSAFDASTSAFTPEAFMAAVVEGADADPGNAPARYQAKGNIFVGTDEGIWIYS